MNKHIFIINGSGGKGKDTFVKFCSEIIPVFNISSVDKVKEAGIILGWNGGKSEADRLFLADMKFLSSRYNDQPYTYIMNKIKEFDESLYWKLMFIHIREPKEIDKVRNNFNCKTILVKNIHVEDIKSNEADANVYNYNYDFIVPNNDDLGVLKQLAYNFIAEVINE